MSTPAQAYVEQWTKTAREEWFKYHVATTEEVVWATIRSVWDTPFLIKWQNPKSWNYGCRFIVHRRWLIVVGDIGEAVYEWSEDISLDFLAGLNFGYFLGKCQASEVGRSFYEYDDKVRKLQVAAKLLDMQETEECERPKSYKRELEILEKIDRGNFDGEDPQKAGQEIYDLTGDAETAGEFSDFGKVPNTRAIGHFVGIQMAIAQLKAKAA